jgi:hypothetical protein
MIDVYAKHLPYEDGHLGEVVGEMRRLGAPTLRVIWYDGKLMALEGSHRLAACHHLGLTPLLLVEEPDLPTTATAHAADTLPAYKMDVIVMPAAFGNIERHAKGEEE